MGNALGVGLVGIVFYGALGTVPDAFKAALLLVMAFCGVTAVLAQFLPKR